MLCKFILVVDDKTIELSNKSVANWKEVSYSLERVDYAGMSRELTSKFEFINDAYDILFDEYKKKYLKAKAKIEVYTITNNHEYELRYSLPIDFSSFNKENSKLSANAIDDSVSALVKANKGTKYEIPVDDIKDTFPLYYDRLSIYNSAKYYPYDINYGSTEPVSPENDEVVINYNDNVYPKGYLVFPLMFSEESSEIYNGVDATVLDNSLTENYGAIIKINSTKEVTISMDFHLKKSSRSAFDLRIVSIQGSMQQEIGRFYMSNGTEFDVKYTFIVPRNYLFSGYMIKIDFGTGYEHNGWLKISNFKEFSVKYTSLDKPVSIDVIKPAVILNSLLKKMNNDKEDITGEIANGIDTRLDKTLIVAAESLRKLSEAKIYSSYGNFTEWMESVFGFVPVVNEQEKKVTFTHRSRLFTSVVSKSISVMDANTSFSIDDSLIYSSVKVGYEKQDYDNINGRDEFRFTNEFTTGIDITDKSYDLISPYRADACGIEFLVQSISKDSTDTKSDNDVFFVGAEYKETVLRYELIRTGYEVSGVGSPLTMFNAMFSPRFMIEANRQFIGIFASNLRFASSEGNSNVVINGIREDDDVEIADALFTVGVLNVTTDDDILPGIYDLVRVEYDGDVYLGYVKSTGCKYGQYDGMKYKLFVKAII